ncbi:MAG TPA: hypothetical protein VHQ01_05390 [Pyrinomonadaceae bacterium]|nr:hypothetical protein [Pyrinomonadaceae bacterium]
MCSNVKGLFKRVLPFFATFVIGLFIASFFVDVSGPRFNFRARGWERHQMNERLRIENDRLRDENIRLQNELDSTRFNPGELRHIHREEMMAPDVSMPVPLSPPPPAAPRVRR